MLKSISVQILKKNTRRCFKWAYKPRRCQ